MATAQPDFNALVAGLNQYTTEIVKFQNLPAIAGVNEILVALNQLRDEVAFLRDNINARANELGGRFDVLNGRFGELSGKFDTANTASRSDR
ncbi:MAG: hypothetical protein M1840_002496 [Geoglossum simile]|nr:MAG: hypothetical protein M1840_002496 [Geoglossum simile]